MLDTQNPQLAPNEQRDEAAEKSVVVRRYIISIVFAIGFFVVISLALGLFAGPDETVTDSLASWVFHKLCDTFFIEAVIFLAAAGLLFCSRLGAYDAIAFGVRQAVGIMFKSPERMKYKDMYEYVQDKQQNRPEFKYLLWIGLVLIVLAIVCLVLYHVV